MSWDQQFFDPIELPKGKKLITLREAATYITKLPKAEHDAAEWQASCFFQAMAICARWSKRSSAGASTSR
jgi:hypothetical protein